jgi:hypothetical protein
MTVHYVIFQLHWGNQAFLESSNVAYEDPIVPLGISKHAVEIAYCAALEELEVMRCQAILESGRCAGRAN